MLFRSKNQRGRDIVHGKAVTAAQKSLIFADEAFARLDPVQVLVHVRGIYEEWVTRDRPLSGEFEWCGSIRAGSISFVISIVVDLSDAKAEDFLSAKIRHGDDGSAYGRGHGYGVAHALVADRPKNGSGSAECYHRNNLPITADGDMKQIV